MFQSPPYNIELYRYPIGSLYLICGILGLAVHILLFALMMPLSRNYFGFRVLLHMTVANVVPFFEFSVWNGIVLISKNAIVTTTIGIKMYSIVGNIFWWSSFYFYIAIALTRFICLLRPAKTPGYSPLKSHIFCGIIWFIALVQSVAICNINGYATVYFDTRYISLLASSEYYTGFYGSYYILLTFSCLGLSLFLYCLSYLVICIQSTCFKNFMGAPVKPDPVSMVTVIKNHNTNGMVKKKRNYKLALVVEKCIVFPYFAATIAAIITQVCIFANIPSPARDILMNMLIITQFCVGHMLLLINSKELRKQLVSYLNRLMKNKEAGITADNVTTF